MTKNQKTKDTTKKDKLAEGDSDNDTAHSVTETDEKQATVTPRPQRSQRLISTDTRPDLDQKLKTPTAPAKQRNTSPKTGAIKKIIPQTTQSDGESDDDTHSVRSSRSDTSYKGKMLPSREAKQKAKEQQDVECNSIDDVIDLCKRLSNARTQAIVEYIQNILHKNDQMAELLEKFHQDLTKKEEIIQRLSTRLDAVESKIVSKPPNKVPTFAQAVAKPTTKPKTIKELAKFIPNLKPNQPQNVAKIMPPKGTPYPDKAIVNIYNPAEHNIKVRSLRTTSTKDLIVRTNSPEDIEKLSKATALTKHGYKVITFKPRNPKILIFGLNISDKKQVVEDIFNQNEEIAGNDIFEQQFRPSHSWSRNKKLHNWVIEVDPIIRKKIIDNGSRLYNQWQTHRVVDYIDATRCFKCQRYGHVAKHCLQKEETCGHCSMQGHSFKVCPNVNDPPTCPPCKQNKLPVAHRIADKTCPTFLKAAKQQLLRTNYGN